MIENWPDSSALERVAELMSAAGAALAGPVRATPLAAGRSNLTLMLEDGRSKWVLRTPPRVGRTPSAHDVLREFRVVTALGSTDVPVPRAVVSSADDSVLGQPFAVTEHVAGRVLQTREQLFHLPVESHQALAWTLVAVLASIHAVDPTSVGLADFGRPHGYAERQVRRWSTQWGLVGLPHLDLLSREVSARLAERSPTQGTSAIVHGDFRVDNTILEESPLPAVAAVVDWELSTLGDPVADVALMCAYRDEAFDLVIGEVTAWTSPSLPEEGELASWYEAVGGARLHDWEFHLALASFKIAVIAAGIDHRQRALDGQPASAAAAVEPFLVKAQEALRGVRASH